MALAQLLGAMWKPSDNLIAELLLESIGARDAGCITDARTCGIAAEQTWLARIGVAPSTVSLVDGSGLSAYDRITPRDLVAVLLHDWTGTHRETIANALPVAGVSGTLAARFAQAPLAGNLTAKTGSKRHVRALAGFVQNAAGHELAFAFTIDDWFDGDPHASQALIAAQAAILLSLLRG
jgi:D-alanyl-D-alanine carboxypeptidase/D-alanyl-D-alanine-endopeptidase (penicillin-binding protein 4)